MQSPTLSTPRSPQSRGAISPEPPSDGRQLPWSCVARMVSVAAGGEAEESAPHLPGYHRYPCLDPIIARQIRMSVLR